MSQSKRILSAGAGLPVVQNLLDHGVQSIVDAGWQTRQFLVQLMKSILPPVGGCIIFLQNSIRVPRSIQEKLSLQNFVRLLQSESEVCVVGDSDQIRIFVFVLHDDLIIAIQLSFEYPLHHDQEIIVVHIVIQKRQLSDIIP